MVGVTLSRLLFLVRKGGAIRAIRAIRAISAIPRPWLPRRGSSIPNWCRRSDGGFHGYGGTPIVGWIWMVCLCLFHGKSQEKKWMRTGGRPMTMETTRCFHGDGWIAILSRLSGPRNAPKLD